MRNAFLKWNPLAGNPEYEALAAQGWEYRDVPKMLPEYWELITSIIGNENIKILSFVETKDKEGKVWHRGQFLVSAKGRENLGNYKDRRS